MQAQSAPNSQFATLPFQPMRRAALMLQSLDAGKRIDAIDYPVQAVRVGHSLTVIALVNSQHFVSRARSTIPGSISAGQTNLTNGDYPPKRTRPSPRLARHHDNAGSRWRPFSSPWVAAPAMLNDN